LTLTIAIIAIVDLQRLMQRLMHCSGKAMLQVPRLQPLHLPPYVATLRRLMRFKSTLTTMPIRATVRTPTRATARAANTAPTRATPTTNLNCQPSMLQGMDDSLALCHSLCTIQHL
jgi:hypothetical protein